jgi:hypothetical protein
MVLNAIEMRVRIDSRIDRVRSPRFKDDSYYDAINEAIEAYIEDRTHNIKQKKTYSAESFQRVRDELYTLYKIDTGAPVGNVVAYPSDFYGYLLMYATIAGERQWCRPTDHNQLGPLLEHSFRKPSDTKPYFLQDLLGLTVQRGTAGAFSAHELHYIKAPAIVSIGDESDKLTSGATLTNLIVYYVNDEAVYNGTTYYPGDTITGTGTALTSGTVIASTNVTDCDLPDRSHKEIYQRAANIMMGVTEDYNKKQDIEKDVEKS